MRLAIESAFYLFVTVIFSMMILRTLNSKRQLKLENEIFMVANPSKSILKVLNNKVLVNTGFISLTVFLSVYAVLKDMYVANRSSLISVYFCLFLAYFEWYGNQQKITMTKTGINIGVDHVKWESVHGYYWEEDALRQGVRLRIKRKSKMPFAFTVDRSDVEKLESFLSIRLQDGKV